MSCQVHLTACIEDIGAIRRCLFPTDDNRGSDNWLQQCKISVSPIGDYIILANERKIVVLSSKWNTQSSTKQFEILYSGQIHDYDKVKAVVLLPIVGKDGHTKTGPEWTSILVGFDSGHIRCYTENCELLLEEQLHAENITHIKCQSQHTSKPDIAPYLKPEEVYVQYQSSICILKGNHLCNILRARKAQLEAGDYIDNSQNPITFKKLGLEEQSIINSSAVVGMTMNNPFDYLVTASASEGYESQYTTTSCVSNLVVAAGSKPFLGYHYDIERGSSAALSDVAKEVAKAMASKLKTAILPGWLTAEPEKPTSATQPVLATDLRFGLCDLHRTATDIILSPDRKWAAVSDSLGRVLLADTHRGIVTRIFKGYRDAQCSFILVPEEKITKHRYGNKVALFLVIYTPKKGTLDIFTAQKGARIATFSASKHSRLVHIGYGLMGFANSTKSKYRCCYTTVFIDNDGKIKEFDVPFHFALSEENSKRSRDIHLYKKLRQLLKAEDREEACLLSGTLDTCSELQTIEIKSQTVDMLLTHKHLPASIPLEAVKYFAGDLSGKEAEKLRVLCENAAVLLELYVFVSKAEEASAEGASSTVKLEGKEMENLQRLVDLSVLNDYEKLPGIHVSFSEAATFSAAEFLTAFELSQAEKICLKTSVGDEVVFKTSEVLFQRFVLGSTPEFEEELQSQLISSKIPTKNLFDLLVSFWVSRSLHISTNLEKEITNLYRLILALTKTAEKYTLTTEYSEVSAFWEEIRGVLGDSVRPFPALIAAILCKKIAHKLDLNMEDPSALLEDESMEVLSQESVQWSILIGKLEDVSLLNIILSKDPVVDDCPVPPLEQEEFNISLKYVLEKGKGCVTELVAKWLTSKGTNPESVVPKVPPAEDDLNAQYLEEYYPTIPTNVKLVEQLKLLRVQFPYSLEANALLASMVWEYALAWRKDVQSVGKLEAAVRCLELVEDLKIKQGLHQLLWNAHLKIVINNVTKLINEAGTLPNVQLCQQITSLSDTQITHFIKISTDFLDTFMSAVRMSAAAPKPTLFFEDIWENDGQAFVELAAQQKGASYDLVAFHHQLSMVLMVITTLKFKFPKPIDTLFEAVVVNLFFTDIQRQPKITCNHCDAKLTAARTKFLCKIIACGIESITVDEYGRFCTAEFASWITKCYTLAEYWDLDQDVLRKYQVVWLFYFGFDGVAEDIIWDVRDRKGMGRDLMKVAGRRMKKFLAVSNNYARNNGVMTTMVTGYLRSLKDKWCQSTPLDKITRLSYHALKCFKEEDPDYKLAYSLWDSFKHVESINRK